MSNENASTSLQEFFGDPISVYTREQAVDDGVLVDVTDVAKEAGFRLNTCVTHAVWEDCCAWTEDDDQQSRYPQDQDGRTWDVLFMAGLAARKKEAHSRERVHFSIMRQPRPGSDDRNKLVTLRLVISPGDNGEAVLTIMLPHED
jgi:hypothetical protein